MGHGKEDRPMNEWGIALVGLAGALLGAVVGFVGLVWQHRAQRSYDVRKMAADFIALGETMRDSYLERSHSLTVQENMVFLEDLGRLSDQMVRIQRLLELVARPREEIAAHEYWMACVAYQEISENRYIRNQVPTSEQLDDASRTWNAARNGLIVTLNPSKKEKVSLLRRTSARIAKRREAQRFRKALKGKSNAQTKAGNSAELI